MQNNKKIICMIPARLNSQRVLRKNLRLLLGKPLISYCIESALASGVFDDIYVNSEADIFSEIADHYLIKFYKRPPHLSSHKTVNDEFALDFIKNIPGDILVQLLPTSPLITPEEIKGFVLEMMNSGYDTLVSVCEHRIACLYQGNPINFNLCQPHKSSQNMIPVQSYASVLMAWTYKSFSDHIEKYGCAYHGAKGKTGYYALKGPSTIDIDNEEDFALAEVALQYRNNQEYRGKKYYESKKDSPLSSGPESDSK